jgi:hypothetical protein
MATLLGTISTGEKCKFDIDATDPNGNVLFIRLKPGITAGKLPQGLKVDPDGAITGTVAFGHLTVFDSDETTFSDLGETTTFDRTYTFQVEAYSNIGPLDVVDIIEPGIGYTSAPTIEITGGGGYGAQAVAFVSGGEIVQVNVIEPGNNYTFEPTITVTGGGGTGGILRGDIPGGIGISATNEYQIKIRELSWRPWQDLYAVALPRLEDREQWREFASNYNLFDGDMIYRYSDPNFGIQKTPRILVKAGLEPNRLLKYMESLERFHFTKRILFGELKSARAYNDATGEEYEIIYYEIAEREDDRDHIDLNPFTDYGFAPIFASNTFISADTEDGAGEPPFDASMENWGLGPNEERYPYDVYPNSFENMRTHLKDNIGEVVSEVAVVPDWMYDKQEDGTSIGYKPVLPVVYVNPGEAEKAIFRIKQAQINPNDFLFQVDRYEWDKSLGASYDIENNQYAFQARALWDGGATIFDNGDMQFIDAIQQITGNGIDTEYTLDHYVGHSEEVSILSTILLGDITGITNASPAVVTTQNPHGLESGSKIKIINLPGYGGVYDVDNIPYDIGGMVELCDLTFYVRVITPLMFEIYYDLGLADPVDSTLYDPYISNGNFVSDSVELKPVKDYVAQYTNISFRQPISLNNTLTIVFRSYNPVQYTAGSDGDGWLKFPKSGVYK